MEVEFKDGKIEKMECWIEDGKIASKERILEQKMFAAATKGMDYRI